MQFHEHLLCTITSGTNAVLIDIRIRKKHDVRSELFGIIRMTK